MGFDPHTLSLTRKSLTCLGHCFKKLLLCFMILCCTRQIGSILWLLWHFGLPLLLPLFPVKPQFALVCRDTSQNPQSTTQLVCWPTEASPLNRTYLISGIMILLLSHLCCQSCLANFHDNVLFLKQYALTVETK